MAPSAMTCPKCDGEMSTQDRNGVTIEQCGDCHGIYLDRGELERLLGIEASPLGSTGPKSSDRMPRAARQWRRRLA